MFVILIAAALAGAAAFVAALSGWSTGVALVSAPLAASVAALAAGSALAYRRRRERRVGGATEHRTTRP